MGFVFVNIDGQATPLASSLAGVISRLSDCELDQFKSDGVSSQAVFEGNWKLFVEGGLRTITFRGFIGAPADIKASRKPTWTTPVPALR